MLTKLFSWYFEYILQTIAIDRKMVSENNTESIVSTANKIDPTEFDVTVSALLIGAGAEKFINIFEKKNIGQSTLTELTDEDLTRLGVDDHEIRQRILDEIKNLPIFEESLVSKSENNLGALEIIDILEDSSQHLYRIYLSMLANTLALKRADKVSDYLLHKDKYASDISLSALSEITNILNSMDITLHTQLKALIKEKSNKKTKKLIVGTVGSAAIAVLAVLFVKSLKQL